MLKPLDELHARFRMEAERYGWITDRNEDNTRYRNDIIQWYWTFYLAGASSGIDMLNTNNNITTKR